MVLTPSPRSFQLFASLVDTDPEDGAPRRGPRRHYALLVAAPIVDAPSSVRARPGRGF
jgi:hypothetical protein